MRVEREMRGVPAARTAIVLRFVDEMREKRPCVVAIETFGVPLHADDAFSFTAFHCFHNAVGRSRRDAQARPRIGDGLVVERIDIQPFAEQATEQRVGFGADGVRTLGARRLLRVLDERVVGLRGLLVLE